jgi:uncharacterized membrane protein
MGMSIKDVLQGKPLGHPSHPMFVHFPTALFPTSLLFDLLSWTITEPELVKAAFYTMAVGLAGALLAVLTGFVDYLGMVPGSRKHRVTTWHMLANLCLVVIFAVSLSLRPMQLDAARTPLYILALSLVGMPLLLVGNYFGAELVYRMGMRVNTGRLRETPLLLRAVARVRRTLGLQEPV